MKYTISYFIKKFSKIPKKRWTTGRLKYGDACCALGHCGGPETDEARDLTRFLWRVPADINDGNTLRFPQKHPKDRILAALRLRQKRGRKTPKLWK